MVDLERLTVTGQLLGSPAYMAPEHVEGRPLDFRTDVFAAGIVLYQLTVGKLPFEGRNPHEVLKRIAECRFVDPRQANPRIGNRLGRIMLRAMAALPSDRYPAISEMVLALEAYLEESGIAPDKVPGELARYFQAPVSYEQALKDRLVDHLTRRGQRLLADGDQAPALDVFDRVLTIDPDNAKVIAILDGINRRQRLKTVLFAVLGIFVISGGGYLVHRRSQPSPSVPAAPETIAQRIDPEMHSVQPVEAPPPPLPVLGPQLADASPIALPHDAPEEAPADAAPAGILTAVHISPGGKNVQYRVGDGPWLPATDDGTIELTLSAPTKVFVRDVSGCCQNDDHVVEPGKEYKFEINALAGQVVPRCPGHEAALVNVAGQVAHVDEKFPIPFGKSLVREKRVKVEFVDATLDSNPIEVSVQPGKDVDATCVAH
jgi:serine/threonine-protein kinase